MPGDCDYSRFKWSFKLASKLLQSCFKPASTKKSGFQCLFVDVAEKSTDKKKSPARQFSDFYGELCMSKRSKLQIWFWGLKIDAEGIFPICVTLLIVLAVLAASRF